MGIIFFTGFPGFLGAELLPRILACTPEHRATCLVQSKFADLARRRAEELAIAHPDLQDRLDIVEGDITQPGIGIEHSKSLRSSIVQIYHLAAIYDLSVGRDLAMRINVEGTRRMLEFACDCPGLTRFQYVSTCYVSGKHSGSFSEEDLDKGQKFNNFYEETKFLAEVEVRKNIREGLPATIYRPAIVVGDSRTGTTQKYDGPYSIIRFLLRQPAIAILPVVGDLNKTEVNVVPRDFIMDAITFLSARPQSKGRTFQLADPKPLTAEQMVQEIAKATQRKLFRIPVPLSLAKMSLAHIPGMQRLVGIPPDTLDYFVHGTHYTTARTQSALQEGGVRCPHFPEYVGNLVGFVRAHPEVGSAAMA
jgi:thioester reductase-like protein